MARNLSKSILLLFFGVVICCGIYPLVLWAVGQIAFPFEANGSMVKGPDDNIVGSRLIAQPFTKDEYFQPRPSTPSTTRRPPPRRPSRSRTMPYATAWPIRSVLSLPTGADQRQINPWRRT